MSIFYFINKSNYWKYGELLAHIFQFKSIAMLDSANYILFIELWKACSSKNYIQAYILGNDTQRVSSDIVDGGTTRQASGRWSLCPHCALLKESLANRPVIFRSCRGSLGRQSGKLHTTLASSWLSVTTNNPVLKVTFMCPQFMASFEL